MRKRQSTNLLGLITGSILGKWLVATHIMNWPRIAVANRFSSADLCVLISGLHQKDASRP